MKVLYITDTHLTSKTPASRIDNYELTTYKILFEIKKIIKDKKVDIVIHGGDMFHTPKVSLRYAGSIAQILLSYGVPIYVVPGNHDIFGYNKNTIDQTMLGLFANLGVVNLLDRDNPLFVDVGNCTMSIEGQEYYGDIDKGNQSDFDIVGTMADYNLLIYHGMLLDKPFFEGVPHTLIKDVNTTANIVLAGHYHDGFKAQNVNGTFFLNPGATIRVESSRMDMPKVVLFNFEEKNGTIVPSCKYLYLQCAKPREEVFDLQSKAITQQQNAELQTLKQEIDKLSITSNPFNFKNGIQDTLDQFNATQEVRNKVNSYISSIQSATSDKDLFNDGYVEYNGDIYIKEVHIKNFQSHKNTKLEFVNGLNVINGESGKGKSAILRAISWCLWGDLKSSDFIRTGENKCSVKITFSNDYTIIKSRTTKGTSKYKVTDPNGKTEEFSGFGSNIPIEVLTAHQMPEINLSNSYKTKLSYSNQLDGPFLLSKPNSVKADAIGRLVGTDIYDGAVKKCNKDLSDLKKTVKYDKELLKGYEEKISQYDGLDNLKNKIELLKIIKTKTENLKSINENLNKILKIYQQLKIDKEKCENNLKKFDLILENKSFSLNDINDLLFSTIEDFKNFKQYTELTNRIKELENNKIAKEKYLATTKYDLTNELESIKALKDNTIRLKDIFIKYNNLNRSKELCENNLKKYILSDNADDILKDIETKIDNTKKLTEFNSKYQNYINTKKNIDNKIYNCDIALEDNDLEVLGLKRKINKMNLSNQVCPLCGAKLDAEHIINKLDKNIS